MNKPTIAEHIKALHRIEIESARTFHHNGQVHARIMQQAARLRFFYQGYRSVGA